MIPALLLVALISAPPAGRSPTSSTGSLVLLPRTYASPSGTWTLRVVPSKPTGAGDGLYHLARRGRPTRELQLPYTFVHAVVLDDGAFAGVAYSAGFRGNPGTPEGRGDLVIAVHDESGRALAVHRTPRRTSRHPCASPALWTLGAVALPERDEFIVRVREEDPHHHEQWWTYRLSDGAPLGREPLGSRFHPPRPTGTPRSVHPVPGTPLVLTRWELCPVGSRDPRARETRYDLLDLRGPPVWTWTPGTHPDEPWRKWSDPPHGGVLSVETSSFTLHAVPGDVHVQFEITPAPRSPDGWTITEIARLHPSPAREPAP